MIPPEDLAAMEQRCEAATKGPLQHDKGLIRAMEGPPIARMFPPVSWQGVDGYQPKQSMDNGEFFAHSRTDLPRLIAAYKEMAARLETKANLFDAVDSYLNGGPDGKQLERLRKAFDEAAE